MAIISTRNSFPIIRFLPFTELYMFIESWKPTIKIYRKSTAYKPDVDKISTKVCQKCGNEHLLLFRTLNLKTCTDCFLDIPWYLEDAQQSIQ